MVSSAAQTRPVLALVRHGAYEQPLDVPSALLPHPLTAEGKGQARDGARLLFEHAMHNGLTIDRQIHTSCLLRAWESARIIAEELSRLDGRPYVLVESVALVERSLGAAANLSVSQIERVLSRDPRYAKPPNGWKRDPNYRVPLVGAESLMDAGQRVSDYLTTLASARGWEGAHPMLVCVGHGGAFRHAAHLLGLLSRGELSQLSMHHCRPVFVELSKSADTLQLRHVGGEWKQRPQPTLD